ncbi:extracellular endo-alpha-(1-_5)-L-arabinanase 1 [Alicyclobacillus cellulosilyticus]|uniref:Endo-alpha-(1->5)-L-arabinanase n=1 Tax=Alicyclobacillus cellulosilyticus TaxID=1003997 RepID=A0A917NI97_9BACL|nr:arabinan endo-1,5-alpha-L-arabinosidase [Alicyclobacillus cellulosilyticus]GGI99929.1 extracellular endo-alpha-(1->5)-L-arabinanase 1 [Alicyclobacillus cellulosilyticus]
MLRKSPKRVLGWMMGLMAAISMVMDVTANATPGLDYDFVHDPSMVRDGHTFYVFSTGDPQGAIGGGNIQIRSSTDLVHWKYVGTVFDTIPSWITDQVGNIPNLWAPDVSYYHGQYQVYYAGSSFGSNNSVIGLATNKTLDPRSPQYKWIDRGMVFQSTSADPFNAIDPNFTVDANGQPWLVFGSFWSGIKMIKLNPNTGKPVGSPPKVYSLAYRPEMPHAIEAPSLVYRKPYYYLFVSFGFCCRGVDSTYTIRVGRSKNITGPYVDKSGKPMMQGGGTLLLGNQGDMIGPGGQSVYRDGNTYYLVYHFYDASDAGNPKLQIRKLTWTKDGWPVAGHIVIPAPYY